jgi:hypothetical protein
MDFYIIYLYQIIKFFDAHSTAFVAFSTIILAVITGYYAIQTRFLTKNQLRPAFALSLTGLSQNSVGPLDMVLNLKNVGIGVAFNLQVEYAIKGVKRSNERKMIDVMEHDMEKSFQLVQGCQPLRSDGLANRILQVKLKYEGISGKYKSKHEVRPA